MWIYFYSSWVETKLQNAYIEEYHPPKEFNGDLSLATQQNRTSFTPSYSGAIYEVILDDTGTKMFIGNATWGWHGGGILQYTLPTAWDITSINTSGTVYWVGSWSRDYPDPCFCDDGNKLFNWYSSSGTYARYDLSTAYDLTTVDWDNPDYTIYITDQYWAWIQSVSADGKTYLIRPWSARSLTYSVSTTAWQPVNSQTALLSSSNIMTGTFCNEWKMLMVMDGTTIKKYELSTPYDVTTLNTTPIQTQATGLSWNPRWIHVDRYGDNIYINVNSVIYRYNLV